MRKFFKKSIDEVTKNPAEKSQDKKEDKAIFEAVKYFETDIIDAKNKRIKFLSFSSLFLLITVVLMALAIVFLSPLKTSVPYLIRVDSTTGYVDKVEPYNLKSNTVDQSISRYFIARYVENREGYEWNTIQSMYDFVELTSSSSVFSAYKMYIMNDNSPIKRLGKGLKMQVKVNSITNLGNNTATVRFTKLIVNQDGSLSSGYEPSKWIATVKYDFDKALKNESQRLLNPLGFDVISYKVDAEVVK